MQLEVEQKFRVTDHAAVREQLLTLGAEARGVDEQWDEYLRHPGRDFTVTGEALRLRRVNGQPFITYKGPKQSHAVKTRRELEFPLGIAGERLPELLEALGFQSVAQVSKHRERFHLTHDGMDVEVALDVVDRVGRFVEVEVVAEEEAIENAQRAVLTLAQELGLTELEPRSYLRMLLEQGEASGG